METRLITDRKIWNDFIRRMPTGHICQTYEWAEHLSETARTGSLCLGVLDGDRLVAAMALVRSRAHYVREPYYYVPRGPVCADPASPALLELVAFARHEASRQGAFMIRIEPNVPDGHEQAAKWLEALGRLGFRSTGHALYPRSAWVTDLRPREDELLAHMTQTWRYGIHAGARRGITVRQGAGEADCDAFYHLLVETSRRDHFPRPPRALYHDMLAHYTPERAACDGTAEMALFLAEFHDRPIAGATVAVLGKGAWYMHAASSGLPEHRKLDPSRLLLWECVRWAKQHGAEFYDWRAIPDVPKPGEELYGVYAFKRGFGGYAQRVIPTHDLILRPSVYWPYMAVASLHRRWHAWRRHAFETRRWSDHLRQVSSQRAPERASAGRSGMPHGGLAPT